MGKPVVFEESYAMLERRRGALLKRIAKVGPFLMATASYIQVRCGNKNCKCAKNKKDRHEKLQLSWMDAKGAGSAYVPIHLRPEVLQWIDNYWLLKELMTEMTHLGRRMIKAWSRSHPRAKKNSG